ncbi:MAG: lysophospholipid acyltransferase family protein [Bacteroidales bacterium]|nr:lysophospholipid acyltransferase family protein [Bacteroidales bacterium]
MGTYDHNNWHGTTDGTPWMQRTLLRLFRFLPLWLVYGVTALVIPFYLVFDRRGYRASYAFYRRRLGRGPLRSFLDVYANELSLGKVVMDRFALYAGRKFDMQVEDMPVFERLSAGEAGFVQVSSHVGNYEMAGYTLRTDRKRMFALVFAGETETVMTQRAARFSGSNIEMVPIADDMSHLFTLNSALLDGAIVSMPGDRIFGSQKSFRCEFFGAPAQFPAGPFLLAAQRSVPMLSVFVMKEGLRRYRAYIRPLGEGLDAGLPARSRAEALAAGFARELEAVVRRYPHQWFNFYDFWK